MKYKKAVLVVIVIAVTLLVFYVGGSWAMDQMGNIHTPRDHSSPSNVEEFVPPPGHTPPAH